MLRLPRRLSNAKLFRNNRHSKPYHAQPPPVITVRGEVERSLDRDRSPEATNYSILSITIDFRHVQSTFNPQRHIARKILISLDV